MMRSAARAGVLMVMLFFAAGAPQAQPASQPPPIVIGFTGALSGAQAPFGNGLLQGARLALARANAAGGVAGRALQLVALDDAGDARRAAANARALLEQGAVALTGAHGAEVTLAVAESLVPPGERSAVAALVGPATGAEALREPARPGVYHLRAGLAEEASAAVLHLDTIGVTRYALITQGDALGESGRERLLHELTRIALRPVAAAHVPAGAAPHVLRAALDKACAAEPEALLLALDGAAVSELLPLAKARRCAGQHVVFSEAGAALATPTAGAATSHPLAGVLVTQVMPHPGQLSHPLVAEYRQALAAQDARDASYPSLEGYLAARVIVAGLRACGRDASRACLLRALGASRLDLPGGPVQFDGTQRLARPFVEITMLDARGRFRR
jgi:branched-chain amino acid transport system substrate-binding protein